MHRRQFIALGAAFMATPTLLRAEDAFRMRDFYEKDQSFTPLAKELQDERISVNGYMAPPLKADSTFFVLTKRPMAVCPFCETEAEWPDDIMAVYTQRVFRVVPFNRRITVTGVLSLGGYKDPETGFVSRVRLEKSTFELV